MRNSFGMTIMAMKRKKLPVINSCDGCGVCCLHMGYPAFILPRPPHDFEQDGITNEIQQLLDSGWTKDELRAGIKGESYWHSLSEELRTQWQSFVDNYEKTGPLDGPCFWLDAETRQCKHHQYRPQVCRDFEIGSPECHQWRTHYRSKIQAD